MHQEQRIGQNESSSMSNSNHESEVNVSKYSGSFGRKQEPDGTPSF